MTVGSVAAPLRTLSPSSRYSTFAAPITFIATAVAAATPLAALRVLPSVPAGLNSRTAHRRCHSCFVGQRNVLLGGVHLRAGLRTSVTTPLTGPLTASVIAFPAFTAWTLLPGSLAWLTWWPRFALLLAACSEVRALLRAAGFV